MVRYITKMDKYMYKESLRMEDRMDMERSMIEKVKCYSKEKYKLEKRIKIKILT